MTVGPDIEYAIFQKDILEKLRTRSWFIPCIAFNYDSLAAKWGCATTLSERRLGEAFDFWVEDQTRTLAEGIATGSRELDHFKHASFISFWLRRMLPINETRLVSQYRSVLEDPNATEEQKFFLRYGNELCAFLVGFQLCLFYEGSLAKTRDDIYELRPDRLAFLRQCAIPPGTVADFVMILKHKNMSPHALYLLYKSLFTTIVPSFQA